MKRKYKIVISLVLFLITLSNKAFCIPFCPIYHFGADKIPIRVQRTLWEQCEKVGVDYRYAFAIMMAESNFKLDSVILNDCDINLKNVSLEKILKEVKNKCMDREKLLIGKKYYKSIIEKAYYNKYKIFLTEYVWDKLINDPLGYYVKYCTTFNIDGTYNFRCRVLNSIDIGMGFNSSLWKDNQFLLNEDYAIEHFMNTFIELSKDCKDYRELVASYRAGYEKAHIFANNDREECLKKYDEKGISKEWYYSIYNYVQRIMNGYYTEGVECKGYYQMICESYDDYYKKYKNALINDLREVDDKNKEYFLKKVTPDRYFNKFFKEKKKISCIKEKS